MHLARGTIVLPDTKYTEGIRFLSETHGRPVQLLDNVECKAFQPRRCSPVTKLTKTFVVEMSYRLHHNHNVSDHNVLQLALFNNCNALSLFCSRFSTLTYLRCSNESLQHTQSMLLNHSLLNSLTFHCSSTASSAGEETGRKGTFQKPNEASLYHTRKRRS